MDSRHYRAVALALLLFAAPAFAGGICADKWTGSDAITGTTPDTYWTQTISGGVIGLHDALRVRVSGEMESGKSWSDGGNAWLELNGQELNAVLCLRAAEFGWIDVTITRTGTTTATVETLFYVDGVPLAPLNRWEATGLSWGSSQTLAVKGYADGTGGALLTAICVER